MIRQVLNRADAASARADAMAPQILPLLTRLVFAGVLLVYFLSSGWSKIGTGPLSPDIGAFYQIFPGLVAAADGNLDVIGILPRLVILAGTIAEIVLPVLIVVGLFTRLAALGMIGFIVVQSLTDIYGHGSDAATIGTWFDRASDALILDQRAFWVLALVGLVLQGGGALSLDRLARNRLMGASPA